MKADIRFYTPDDIDGLVQFWNENGGWDVIDRAEWEKRFYHTPHGPASIVIALDESQKIVGQFIFIPAKVSVDNEIYDAYRPQAPVIRSDVRTALGMLTLFEYISKMYKFAVRSFIKQKIYIIYMLPYRRWARAFKFIKGTSVDNFPLWSFSLQNDAQEFILPPEYSTETIKPDDKRINDLWERSSALFKCCAVRDASVLPWKLSLKKFTLIGIMNNERLIGLCASLYSEPDKQWLICDILAESEEILEITIKAACNQAILFKQTLADSDKVRKVAILSTPLIEKIISGLSFYKDAYDFSVVIHILDSKFNKTEIAPKHWYFSAND
jgi:hypothetical protein